MYRRCAVHRLGACGLRCARNNFDLVRRDDLTAAVHFEGNILELEGPDFVAESVRVETSLESRETFVSLQVFM